MFITSLGPFFWFLVVLGSPVISKKKLNVSIVQKRERKKYLGLLLLLLVWMVVWMCGVDVGSRCGGC
jgi:hypothetical protein